MKKYFLSSHAERVIRERNIQTEWIEETFLYPDKLELDTYDHQLEHKLKIIKEFDNRVLRIIYNKSTEPVVIVTAFFDRRMKGKIK